MIDEKKIIDDIKEWSKEKEIKWTSDSVISLLESAPKIGDWIPCSERLPEKKDSYLCTMESAPGSKFRTIGHYNAPGWTDDSKIRKTIAWQPLPEAYHG